MSSLQLLRIEHKLDLLICALQHQGLMIEDLPQLEDVRTDICPICRHPIKFSIDITTETYTRACGCKPPIPIVPGISGVMTPPDTTPSKDQDNGPEPTEAPREG